MVCLNRRRHGRAVPVSRKPFRSVREPRSERWPARDDVGRPRSIRRPSRPARKMPCSSSRSNGREDTSGENAPVSSLVGSRADSALDGQDAGRPGQTHTCSSQPIAATASRHDYLPPIHLLMRRGLLLTNLLCFAEARRADSSRVRASSGVPRIAADDILMDWTTVVRNRCLFSGLERSKRQARGW